MRLVPDANIARSALSSFQENDRERPSESGVCQLALLPVPMVTTSVYPPMEADLLRNTFTSTMCANVGKEILVPTARGAGSFPAAL
jgi:hypothetical protein